MTTTAGPNRASPEQPVSARVPRSQGERVRELVAAIQQLSLARSVPEIQQIVRVAARRLTGADGATFVLRDGQLSHYTDENAISPLWKGQRFPLEACISGWVMLHREPAVIQDIYSDDRVPQEAYRPTFVKSVAVVPIRTLDPVGAIGNYWATEHLPGEQEVELLQMLADSTAVALENVRVLQELEQRVADRTAQLEARTIELEDTNRSIQSLHDEVTRNFQQLDARNAHHVEVLRTLAHEVRTPLAAAQGILRDLPQDGEVSERTSSDLADVDSAVSEALEVVRRQLEAARLEAGEFRLTLEDIDVADELAELRAMFRALARSQRVALVVERPAAPISLRSDRTLLGHVLRNLLSNALKFTDSGGVRVCARPAEGGRGVTFTVADTGIGIEPADVERIFEPWEQVDGAQADRPLGSGLGLPLVRRIVEVLGGRIELESEPGRGSAFTVWLPWAPPGR